MADASNQTKIEHFQKILCARGILEHHGAAYTPRSRMLQRYSATKGATRNDPISLIAYDHERSFQSEDEVCDV